MEAPVTAAQTTATVGRRVRAAALVRGRPDRVPDLQDQVLVDRAAPGRVVPVREADRAAALSLTFTLPVRARSGDTQRTPRVP